MEYSDLNELEKIGLAFVAGIIAGNSLEKENEDDQVQAPKHMANEEKIEICTNKVTPKEMAEILDNLKNKVLGGK